MKLLHLPDGRYVRTNPTSDEKELKRFVKEANALNRKLKALGIYSIHEGDLGFWMRVEGISETGWVQAPTPGNARVSIWHKLPNAFAGGKFPSSGIFAVTQADTGGDGLSYSEMAILNLFLDHLHGSREVKMRGLKRFLGYLGSIRNEERNKP